MKRRESIAMQNSVTMYGKENKKKNDSGWFQGQSRPYVDADPTTYESAYTYAPQPQQSYWPNY